MAIRWLKRDAIKLGKYVRKFNAAITRLEKQMPELADSGILPLRLNVAEVKAGIIDRSQLNRKYAQIDRFFKEGARDIVRDEGGQALLRWEYKERRIAARRANNARKALRDKYKLSGDKAAAVQLNDINVGKIEKERAKHLTTPKNDKQGWDNFLYMLERESKKHIEEQFFNVMPSYFKAIRSEIGGENAEKLIAELKRRHVTGAELLVTIAENDSFDFDFIYGPEEAEAKFELLMSLIPDYFGKADIDDDIDVELFN